MGDLGKFDADGNLILVGRSKDVVIRGGTEYLSAGLLIAHPKIFDIAIVGMLDQVMGETSELRLKGNLLVVPL